MTHLKEETILGVRDGEPVDAGARAHLDECAACRRALEEARERAEAVERALSALMAPLPAGGRPGSLEVPVVSGDDARGGEGDERAAAVVTPIDGGRGWVPGSLPPGRGPRPWAVDARAPGRAWTLRWLGRAAALVVVGAGAASALPGPFHGWIPRVFAGGEPSQAPTPAVAPSGVEVGGRMATGDGPVVVRLDGVPSGTRIDVRRVDGSTVGVLAGTGSAFAYASGEVRATVAAGPVTVELPEGLESATLVVNGATYLVVDAAGMDVRGPRADSGAGNLATFRVPD